jgi:hypothetical protein
MDRIGVRMIEAFHIFGAFMAIIAFCVSVYAVIELKAMQKSTHQIQYVPVDNEAKAQTMTKEQKQDPYLVDFDNII